MKPSKWLITAVTYLALSWSSVGGAATGSDQQLPIQSVAELGKALAVGDVVFIRIPYPPFDRIASSTGSWTNHVGIVVDVSGSEPIIAESRVPLSSTTTLSRFAARSDEGRIAVARLKVPVTEDQAQRIRHASDKRLGVLYDTGFDLHSKRQYCSRFVREVLVESTGVAVGQVESFERLLKSNPDADLSFWKIWFLGKIPWDRETITPTSLLRSEQLKMVFDGAVG